MVYGLAWGGVDTRGVWRHPPRVLGVDRSTHRYDPQSPFISTRIKNGRTLFTLLHGVPLPLPKRERIDGFPHLQGISSPAVSPCDCVGGVRWGDVRVTGDPFHCGRGFACRSR